MVHGEEAAKQANDAAMAIFSGGSDTSNMPSAEISASDIKAGINVLDLLITLSLFLKERSAKTCSTKRSCCKRRKGNAVDTIINNDYFKDGEMIIKKGKRRF